jgi:metallo-beta-lactamase family protein
MCEAGRIKHHLKHNLWRSECTVLFSGYQAGGTLGRNILDGARHVTIFGDQIDVRCEICELQGISGHADQEGLVKWLTSFKVEPRMSFINHGDKEVAPWFAQFVTSTLGLKAYAPQPLERFDLLAEQDLPTCVSVDDSHLPCMRELSEAVALLARNEESLQTVLLRLKKESEKKNLSEKQAVRLTNAIVRLASDLEYLGIKWGPDAD